MTALLTVAFLALFVIAFFALGTWGWFTTEWLVRKGLPFWLGVVLFTAPIVIPMAYSVADLVVESGDR